MTETYSPTYYEILGLSIAPDEPLPTTQTLRAAYRRALLRWHPDKANNLNGGTSPPRTSHIRPMIRQDGEVYSIDQISTAYSVLSNAKERRAYDEGLKRGRVLCGGTSTAEGKKFKTGVEVVDLDDLEFDDGEGIWYRGCRCGDDRGFEVKEEDLEGGESDGEVVVGCKGCSLWLRVLFGVVEENVG